MVFTDAVHIPSAERGPPVTSPGCPQPCPIKSSDVYMVPYNRPPCHSKERVAQVHCGLHATCTARPGRTTIAVTGQIDGFGSRPESTMLVITLYGSSRCRHSKGSWTDLVVHASRIWPTFPNRSARHTWKLESRLWSKLQANSGAKNMSRHISKYKLRTGPRGQTYVCWTQQVCKIILCGRAPRLAAHAKHTRLRVQLKFSLLICPSVCITRYTTNDYSRWGTQSRIDTICNWYTVETSPWEQPGKMQ